MNTTLSSRSVKKIPQLALRLGTLPDGVVHWHDGIGVPYLGGEIYLQLSTEDFVARLDGDILHLPLPPAASARQIQDSAEAWLRQQCLAKVEEVFTHLQNRQLVLTTRRHLNFQLSFATRAPWIIAADADTLRCNWRLIEHSPQTIAQHAEKALRQLHALQHEGATVDMFGALPA